MQSLKHLFLIAFLLIFSHSLRAQQVLDGSWIRETSITRKVVPAAKVYERDVMWSKRIWRVIDLRQKMNHPLFFPLEPTSTRQSLFSLIKESLMEGRLTAYSAGPIFQDDEFKVALDKQEIEAMLVEIDTSFAEIIDEPGTFEAFVQRIEVTTEEIKMYKLKEDWFFDRTRGVMDVRIIGIAPMKEVRGPNNELRGYRELFWLYYPECRYVFANAEVFNRQNESEQRTFDDVFTKRMFNSYIVKEANVYNRSIRQEYQGINALLEAEKVKQSITNIEHDLWHF